MEPRMMGNGSGYVCKVLGTVCVLLVTFFGGPALHAVGETRWASSPGRCQSNNVSVSIAPGLPADQQVYVELCTATTNSSSYDQSVELLVPGMTYDHNYWDFPGFGGKYSYVRHANASGHATLSYDRMGTGKSSHPPSFLVGANSNSWVAHQLVQKLRNGEIGTTGSAPKFESVIATGHSYGSGFVWLEASKYKDVDAVILSGLTHYLRYDTIIQKVLPSLIPAPLDPKFAGTTVDMSNLTTRPGTRYQDYFFPGKVDKAVVEQDERLKQTITAAEAAQIPPIYGVNLDIRVPVLLAGGGKDSLFCGSEVYDCTNATEMVNAEKPHLGPQVPSVDGYVEADSGHSMNLSVNAEEWFAKANEWVSAHTS